MKKILTFLLSLVLLFAIIYSPDLVAKEASSDLEVHFIDVGQGDSILVKSDGENMLIDGGKRVASEIVVNYLKEEEVEDIKYIVGTHPHEDHIGGLIEVLENFNVENIMMPDVLNNTIVFEDLLNAIERENLKIKKPLVLDNFNIGNSQATVLAPNSKKYSLTNDYSIVLKLQNGENSFVFTGDAEKESETEMVEAHKSILKADVLKIGHHGSKTSSSAEFVDLIDPDYAVISVAKDNGYNHPNKDILERFKDKDIKIYRTDKDSSVVARSDGENIQFTKKIISPDVRDIFNGISEKLADIKDNLFIKYLTKKIKPQTM